MSKILLITGPAGAGKSSTARAFLKQAAGTWAYINQDDIRQLVKTGYATADGYESDWSPKTWQQWQASIPICCDVARRYNEHAINCLIDFNASPKEFEQWKKYLKGLDYKLVVLLPEENMVLERNKQRDETSRLSDTKVIQNYKKLSKWQNTAETVINNSNGSAADTANQLNTI